MPSVGHLVVGLAASRLHAGAGPLRLRDTAALAALAALPDVDFLARSLGAPPGSPWLHRGAAHSVALCLAAAAAFVALGWIGEPGRRGRALACAALAAVSHPVLDAFTWGGAGLMLWWPLDTARHLAPFHLLEASPMGSGLLSAAGGAFLAWEALLFSPLLVWALWPRRQRHHLTGLRPAPPGGAVRGPTLLRWSRARSRADALGRPSTRGGPRPSPPAAGPHPGSAPRRPPRA